MLDNSVFTGDTCTPRYAYLYCVMEKAFNTYFGGKNGCGVYHNIINEIRPHDVYIEPFLGNGAIFRYKKPAKFSVLNDLDRSVVDRWKLSTIDVSNLPADKLLTSYQFNAQLQYCIYLDPPYPLGSRKSQRLVYNCEMTDEQHEQLLNRILKLPSNVDVLISTYENELYKNRLNHWRLKTFTGQTRNGTATEHLYMNYDNPTGLLHDYRYLGTDFIDRQRIKRKIEREVNKLKSLPPSERNAILSEVLSSFSIDSFV